MLIFPCPSCRTTLQADDEFAGKSIVCPKCRLSATVPASSDAAIAAGPVAPLPLPAPTAITTPDLAEAAQQARSEWRDDDAKMPSIAKDGGAAMAWLRIGVYLFLGACVLALVAALFLPVTRRVHHAAARTQSTNNLKQIGLAFHSFHDTHKRLPFNGTGAAANGDFASGSWAFQILPFIDQGPLFQNINRTSIVSGYMCPGRGRPGVETNGGAWTDYFINNYLNDPTQAETPNGPDQKRTLVGITDGTSNTIMVGHGNIRTSQYAADANVTLSTNIFLGGTTGTMRAGDNGKRNPTGVTLKRDSDDVPTIGSWGGPFERGGLMGLGDATVRMFPYNMQNLGAFLTPTGEEEVVPPDF